MSERADARPNILLIVSDQERQRGWIPSHLTLPNRQRLIDEGLEFTRCYTHSSPCSPSRASLFTGQYVPQHGVRENVIMGAHRERPTSTLTLAHVLRGAGYDTSYLGKWHLALTNTPDMEAYGFSDWEGDDRHYMGWAGTGWYFDPVIARQAAAWLKGNAAGRANPWFLTVALVNPHDVMWFPIDQPSYQEANAAEVHRVREMLSLAAWKDDDPVPAFAQPYDEVFDELPPNFADDLDTKPAVHLTWLHEQQHFLYGELDPTDTKSWLRHLDYYWKLHQAADESLGAVLDALDASGAADDTVVIFTSDHGDMCGSHGLRSKGPFVYEEIMRVPLYVRGPGIPAAATATALCTQVDVARTITALAGASVDDTPTFSGLDLAPTLADPSAPARDHVLFAQDQAWYERCIHTRYAIRGITDGRYKYARYYGVGGGTDQYGQPSPEPKRFGEDAPFDDQEHELYDLVDDPHELVNLARDPGHAGLTREWFGRLLEAEAAEFATLRPS
ncbi:MAG: sulfatase-like hydrolase/transferase [Actinobacteria bacterium]|nr:sulfatase-like hydrolase/transferase [Actinomycetota bacterium]